MITPLQNASELRAALNSPHAMFESFRQPSLLASRVGAKHEKKIFDTAGPLLQNRIKKTSQEKRFTFPGEGSTNFDSKGSADKAFVENDSNIQRNSSDKTPVWLRMIPKLDTFANWSAFGANIANFFLQIMNISEESKKKITNTVDFITNLSFIPYGLDGMRKGIKKRNPFQTLGFFLEMTNVWFSNIKTKYLVRGLATGTDQIWVATDTKLAHKYKDGNMLSWANGFKDVPLASWDLLKEIARDPVGTLLTIKSKGHHAILSTLGDIVATLGFAFTGNDKLFGPCRDVAGALFDWELLLRDNVTQKFSGLFFILESSFDFLARFMNAPSMRIAVNSIAHACGRLALSLYKSSDPN